MSTCRHCNAAIFKKDHESIKQYCARKYCNRTCQFAAQKARGERNGKTHESTMQAQAARLGGNFRITNAVLNVDKVRKIRELASPLGFSYREIADHMKVSYECVAKVVRRETWPHIK